MISARASGSGLELSIDTVYKSYNAGLSEKACPLTGKLLFFSNAQPFNG
jgi:hypothetical protein